MFQLPLWFYRKAFSKQTHILEKQMFCGRIACGVLVCVFAQAETIEDDFDDVVPPGYVDSTRYAQTPAKAGEKDAAQGKAEDEDSEVR
jgi:hypothetical protein